MRFPAAAEVVQPSRPAVQTGPEAMPSRASAHVWNRPGTSRTHTGCRGKQVERRDAAVRRAGQRDERAEAVGARLHLDRAEPHGTVVRLSVPMPA